jgi:hypothetical protein
VAKLKSSKKRVLSELDYSLNKKHVLKAVTSKNSKWGERMFEVVKVETSKQGGNVLKLKERSEFFWVREEKFQ